MLHRIFPVVVLILVMLVSFTAAHQKPAEQQGPPPLPTTDELQQMYDAGDYRTAIQQIARVLRLRGAPAEAYDRDAVLLLRGKTLLALDDPRAAKRVFDEVRKSENPDIAMPAHGYFTLLSKSKMSLYTKRNGGAGGKDAQINIADPKNQPDAFNALLDDELPAFEKDAAVAAKADTLNPAIAMVPRMLDLAGVEFAATGKYERVRPIAKQVGDRARSLIGKELSAQEQKINAIERMAEQPIEIGRRRGGRWNDTIRRGLDSNERAELYDLVEYLVKVEDTVKRGLSIAQAVKGEIGPWDALLQQATEVKTHAQYVLDAEGVHTVDGVSNR